MEIKIYLTIEEVTVAVTEYFKIRQPELMDEFHVSEVDDTSPFVMSGSDTILRVTLSSEAAVQADGSEEPQ